MRKAVVGAIASLFLIIGVALIASTYVEGTRIEKESYPVQKHSTIISESFTVSPEIVTHTRYLSGGDLLSIQVQVTSGGNKDINFAVNDGTTTYISYNRATTVSREWTVPSSGNYNFVYDNSFSWITSKDVTVKVDKIWNEIEYRDVVKSYSAYPYEFMYAGIGALFVSGVAFAVLVGIAAKNAVRRHRIKQLELEQRRREEQQRLAEEEERLIEAKKREQLQKARNLETSGRYEEAAKMYEELEMYEKAGECRRMEKTSYQISTNFSLGKDGTIRVNCPNCGSSQVLESKSNLVTCKHCGNKYAIAKKVLDML